MMRLSAKTNRTAALCRGYIKHSVRWLRRLITSVYAFNSLERPARSTLHSVSQRFRTRVCEDTRLTRKRSGTTRDRLLRGAIANRTHCFHAAAWARTGWPKPFSETSPRFSNESPLPMHNSATAFETIICSACAWSHRRAAS
jgi:hypothetical protein